MEKVVQKHSLVPQDKFYIGTKVGLYKWEVTQSFNFSAERVTQSIEESLQRLQLDYVDILQVYLITAQYITSFECIIYI